MFFFVGFFIYLRCVSANAQGETLLPVHDACIQCAQPFSRLNKHEFNYEPGSVRKR